MAPNYILPCTLPKKYNKVLFRVLEKKKILTRVGRLKQQHVTRVDKVFKLIVKLFNWSNIKLDYQQQFGCKVSVF